MADQVAIAKIAGALGSGRRLLAGAGTVAAGRLVVPLGAAMVVVGAYRHQDAIRTTLGHTIEGAGHALVDVGASLVRAGSDVHLKAVVDRTVADTVAAGSRGAGKALATIGANQAAHDANQLAFKASIARIAHDLKARAGSGVQMLGEGVSNIGRKAEVAGAFLSQDARRRDAAKRPPAARAAQPPSAPSRSNYTTRDGRTVDATPAQVKAWGARRQD